MGRQSDRNGTSMSARLGNVLYWTGCLFAGLLVLAGIAMASVMSKGPNPTDIADAPWVGLTFAACALVVWLIGRALRYIFSGT